jgi:protein SCO1/2
MQRNQKILVTILWGAAVLAMIGVVGTGLWAKHQPTQPPLFDAPKFSLTDQNGDTITDANLRGNVWIASVFFTQCPGICPMITMKLAELEKAVPSPQVKVVSLSIDPEHDTPAVMKEYAKNMGVDQSRWYFLTGPKTTIYELATQGFKLAATPAKEGNSITHTQKVLLVDRDNEVRGVYDTNDDDSMKKLADDVKAMIAE